MKPQRLLKKTNLIVGILILLAGISIGGYLVLESRSSQANFLKQISQGINSQKIADDLDNDGLAAWEEEIYRTDPNNPDTDGDGYLDGEEVAAGYDPTKPAPDDRLNNDNDSTQPVRPAPGNLTQLLTYILANQIKFDPVLLSNVQDANSLEQVLTQTADERVTEALQKSSAAFLSEFIPPFQKGVFEFETTPENNLKAIREYAGQISDKIKDLNSCQHPENIKDETEIIQEAIEAKDFEQVNCLASSYYLAYQKILETPVPLDWLDIHKNFLTIYWTLHKVHQSLPEYEQDPLKGLLVIEKFKEASKNLDNLIKEMAADIESR